MGSGIFNILSSGANVRFIEILPTGALEIRCEVGACGASSANAPEIGGTLRKNRKYRADTPSVWDLPANP